NLKRFADKIWSVNPNAYVILEHFCDNTEEKALADYGMLIWGNINSAYNEATMGWLTNSNFANVTAKQRGWSNPNLVGYMESHDEERLMYKNITYGNSTNPEHDVKNLTVGLKRVELAANFFIPLPGPKMIWQFGEVGYDVSIDFNGRTGRKPIPWNYYEPDDRRGVFNAFAHLNRLKQDYEVFSTNNYDYSLSGAKKWIKLDGVDIDVVILGNFDVVATDFTIDFPTTGKWYEYYTKDSIELTSTSKTFAMAPAEYRLYTSKKINRDDIYVGIDDITSGASKKSELTIWPNPSNGSFNIQVDLTVPSAVNIEVFNLLGQRVYSKRTQFSAGVYAEPIELSSRLTNGVYLIKVQTKEQTQMGKLSIFR
nr:T9SS type A sorting domain-containing protein [Tenuifilaceae bacterium]